MFDFGNYSPKSKYYDDSNKLVVGKMKDKTAGVAIKEFVGLKPKMYSFLVDDNSEHKKAKGINKNFVERKRSWWRLKRLRAEPPPISKHPVRFTGHKAYGSGNKNFSNCHMTSCWSHDQRVMWF